MNNWEYLYQSVVNESPIDTLIDVSGDYSDEDMALYGLVDKIDVDVK